MKLSNNHLSRLLFLAALTPSQDCLNKPITPQQIDRDCNVKEGIPLERLWITNEFYQGNNLMKPEYKSTIHEASMLFGKYNDTKSIENLVQKVYSLLPKIKELNSLKFNISFTDYPSAYLSLGLNEVYRTNIEIFTDEPVLASIYKNDNLSHQTEGTFNDVVENIVFLTNPSFEKQFQHCNG